TANTVIIAAQGARGHRDLRTAAPPRRNRPNQTPARDPETRAARRLPMDPNPNHRLDKWLWAVRIFRSRTLATEACASGHVQINGQRAKPGRSVHVGEIILATNGGLTRTVKVLALLDRRVGAKLVPQYLEDLTPASEYAKQREE